MIFSTSHLAARACEIPEYHITDRVQPHAVLVVVERSSLTLCHVSANASRLFGTDAASMLGTSLADYVNAQSLERVRALAAGETSAAVEAHAMAEVRIGHPDAAEPGISDAWVHASGSQICLEFLLPVPQASPPELAELDFARLLAGICNFQGSARDLAARVCDAIHCLTGFARVYYCQFDDVGNGYVPAEALHGHFPSLLDHHFPATDIPQKVRQLYVGNRFRLIPDSSAATCAILAQPGRSTTLDLTASTCREIGPTHLLYLRNMGAVASTSFSVVEDDRLIALFGAHHHEPRHLSYRQLLRCKQLADSYSNRSAVLRMRLQQTHLRVRHAQVIDAAVAFSRADCDLVTFAGAAAASLAAMFDADGVVASDGDSIYAGALTPSDAQQLLAWCADQLRDRDWVRTHELSRDHPEFAGLRDRASGVFGFALDHDAKQLIVLIKREVLTDRSWAGDPRNAVRHTSDGGPAPRKSFQTYVEHVEGTSTPWDGHCTDLATALKYACNQALLANGMRAAAVRQQQLNSTASHEFRTPLAIIDGAMQRLSVQLDDQNTKAASYVQRARDAVARINALIDRTLANARVEEAQLELAPQPVDLKELVVEICNRQRQIAPTFVIRLRLPESEVVVEGNKDMLDQVLTNLLSNAVKYSGSSRILDVAVVTTANGVDVVVRDFGIGISADEVPKLFTRFFRARTAEAIPGTGIGLNLVRDLVLLHGGTISVTSALGLGSTFTVSLPMAQIRDGAHGIGAAQSKALMQTLASTRAALNR